MKKSTFEAIYKKAKANKSPIHICIEGLESHGGYSASSIEVCIDPHYVELKEDYIILNNLYYQYKNSYSGSSSEDHSKLQIHTGTSKLNTAWIEYDRIIYGGIN